MVLNNLAAMGVKGTHRAIVRPLWPGVAVGREARGCIGLHIPQEVFLLKSKPEIIIIVVDGRTSIGLMRGAVGVKYLGHD